MNTSEARILLDTASRIKGNYRPGPGDRSNHPSDQALVDHVIDQMMSVVNVLAARDRTVPAPPLEVFESDVDGTVYRLFSPEVFTGPGES